MPYTKTNWAAGNRVSIERMNKIEDAISAAHQKNAMNQSLSQEVAGIFLDAESDIDLANGKITEAGALLATINPPVLLKDGWSLFDGGSAASSTAANITRTLSGFVTRAIDAALFRNNGDNIEILQPGRYLIARSVRLSGARAIVYRSKDSSFRDAFLYGGSGSTYRTIHTVGFMEIYKSAPAGTQVIIKVQSWGNSSGMSLTFTDGKIAIKKVG